MFKVRKGAENRSDRERRSQKVLGSGFITTFLYSFHPKRYNELANRPAKKVASYYFSLIFVIFIIATLIALPQIITFSSYLENQISHFDEFKIDITQKMDSPIIATEDNPKIVVDTAGMTNISDYGTP